MGCVAAVVSNHILSVGTQISGPDSALVFDCVGRESIETWSRNL